MIDLKITSAVSKIVFDKYTPALSPMKKDFGKSTIISIPYRPRDCPDDDGRFDAWV